MGKIKWQHQGEGGTLILPVKIILLSDGLLRFSFLPNGFACLPMKFLNLTGRESLGMISILIGIDSQNDFPAAPEMY